MLRNSYENFLTRQQKGARGGEKYRDLSIQNRDRKKTKMASQKFARLIFDSACQSRGEKLLQSIRVRCGDSQRIREQAQHMRRRCAQSDKQAAC